MDSGKLPPVHPGEILDEEFLVPLGISQDELAESIGMDAAQIHAIVRGDRAIDAEIALFLSKYFDTSAKFWTGLQARYDLDVADDQLAAKLREIKPRSRNGATSDDQLPQLDECLCGCGESPESDSAFLQEHDQKALHKVIKSEYGSVSEFLQHHGYT